MTNRLEELLPEPTQLDYGLRLQLGDTQLYTKEQMIQFAKTILNESYDVVRGFTYLEEMGSIYDGEPDHYEELEAAECLEKHFNTQFWTDNE